MIMEVISMMQPGTRGVIARMLMMVERLGVMLLKDGTNEAI